MSDYISREAAIAVAEDAQNKLCPLGWWGRRFAFDKEQYNLWQELIEKLEAIPAADVEPVRHGNWNIRLADEMTLCLECSICGRRVDNIDLHYLLEAGEYGEACRRYPYCHCGSKMDLEEHNGT